MNLRNSIQSMGRHLSSSCCRVFVMLVALMWLRQPPPVSCFNVNVRPASSNERFVHDQRCDLGAIKDNRDTTSVILNRSLRRIGCTASSRWLSPSMTLTSGAETIIQDPVSSSAGAKRTLFRLLAKRVHQDDEHRWMQDVLATLERLFVPIQTVGFFNLAIKGDWHLCYTNSHTRPIGPRLAVKSLYQKLEPGDSNQGNLVNVIEWHLLDEDITGRLEVGCTYELDRRGRMVVSLKGHRLLPDSKMPKDPNDLVSILQRAMPYEMFDPSGCAMHTSFLDGNIRVARMEGGRHDGRVNVFLRDPSVLPITTASEDISSAATGNTSSSLPPSSRTSSPGDTGIEEISILS